MTFPGRVTIRFSRVTICNTSVALVTSLTSLLLSIHRYTDTYVHTHADTQTTPQISMQFLSLPFSSPSVTFLFFFLLLSLLKHYHVTYNRDTVPSVPCLTSRFFQYTENLTNETNRLITSKRLYDSKSA